MKRNYRFLQVSTRKSVCLYVSAQLPRGPSFAKFGIVFYKNLFIYSEFGYKHTLQEDLSKLRTVGRDAGKVKMDVLLMASDLMFITLPTST